MLAIAWVDTPEGRRWFVRRGVFFLLLGTIPFAIGRIIGERLLIWFGGALFAYSLWHIALPYLHIRRGLPLRVTPDKTLKNQSLVPGQADARP